jgi:hypothetical protein
MLKGRSFSHIFTHGQNGEYGHPRHKGAHLAVREMIKDGLLKTGSLYFFDYEKKYDREFSPLKAASHPDIVLPLSDRRFKGKKQVMARIYGFAPDGIDTNYCTNPEAFKIFVK